MVAVRLFVLSRSIPLLSAEREVQQAAKGLCMRCDWVRELVFALLLLSEERVYFCVIWIGMLVLWGVLAVFAAVWSVWRITLVLEKHTLEKRTFETHPHL